MKEAHKLGEEKATDSNSMRELIRQLHGKKEPAREVETAAGILKIKAEPFGPIGDLGRLYYVSLKPSPSSKEKGLGHVTAPFEKLRDIDDNVELHTAFIKEGLGENAKIAELFTVFPLGIAKVENVPRSLKPLLRKGIGTETLREVLKDLEFHGVAGVYVSTPEEPLARLLEERFGFKKVDEAEGSAYFFKKL